MDNTQDIFKPLPMSSYSASSQPKSGLNNIRDVSLESMQERIAPRQIATGNNRGEMTIKGLIRVVDTDTTVRLILGYKKGSF
jgi:hypothetical protein